jgi:hypothetical protein
MLFGVRILAYKDCTGALCLPVISLMVRSSAEFLELTFALTFALFQMFQIGDEVAEFFDRHGLRQAVWHE